jgi:hypothetical protein
VTLLRVTFALFISMPLSHLHDCVVILAIHKSPQSENQSPQIFIYYFLFTY